MTGDQLDWVTSLAYSLSLVCDLTLLSPYVSFWPLRAPWHRRLRVPFQHRKQNRLKTSPKKKKNPSTPVWKTSAVLVCLCLEQGVSRPPFCSVRTDAFFQTGCGLTARSESWCFQKLFFSWPLTSAWFQLWTLSWLCPRLVLFLVSLIVFFVCSFVRLFLRREK